MMPVPACNKNSTQLLIYGGIFIYTVSLYITWLTMSYIHVHTYRDTLMSFVPNVIINMTCNII